MNISKETNKQYFFKKEVLIMAETKITYAEALTKAIETEGLEAEVVAKLEALKKSIEKKATNRKPTKAQKENEGYKAIVLESLAQGKGTVGEIAKRNEVTADFSTPKVTALLGALVEEGKVIRTEEGRKAVYALAIPSEEEDAEAEADAPSEE